MTDPSRWARVAGRGGWWLGAALVLTIGFAAAFVYRSTERVRLAQAQIKELQRRYDAASGRLETERQEIEGRLQELEIQNQKLTQERDELAATRADLSQTLKEKAAVMRKLQADNLELKRAAFRKLRRRR